MFRLMCLFPYKTGPNPSQQSLVDAVYVEEVKERQPSAVASTRRGRIFCRGLAPQFEWMKSTTFRVIQLEPYEERSYV